MISGPGRDRELKGMEGQGRGAGGKGSCRGEEQ